VEGEGDLFRLCPGIPLLPDDGPWDIDVCIDGADEVSEGLEARCARHRARRLLYEIERLAKDQGLPAEARLALRTARSLPVLDQFDAWVDGLKTTCLPTSPLGKAVGYAAHQRPFVRRCFTEGRLEIDNGHTEWVLREPCIGRKKCLFTGSADAPEGLAAAYTLVQSCRRGSTCRWSLTISANVVD
jgi:transposase